MIQLLVYNQFCSVHDLRLARTHSTCLAYVHLMADTIVLSRRSEMGLEIEVAKKATSKKVARKQYTTSDVKMLRMHSKARTPVSKPTKLMKRSEGSLRQKALKLGIGLGHQR
jgi:hypothetical protein